MSVGAIPMTTLDGDMTHALDERGIRMRRSQVNIEL
jgi:hypothetical protein